MSSARQSRRAQSTCTQPLSLGQCVRRMEAVTASECMACYRHNPQLHDTFPNRCQCVQANIIDLPALIPELTQEPPAAPFLDALEGVAAQLRREGRTDGEIGAFGRGLMLLIEAI